LQHIDEVAEPDHDGRGGQCAVEDVVAFVVPSRDGPVLLQNPDAAFDGVAPAVLLAVEGRRAAAVPSAAAALRALVVRLGNRCSTVAGGMDQVGRLSFFSVATPV
jgi:hypothetical protein